MDIRGRTIIITGISGKLTSEIAYHLAAEGANCICIYHKNVEKTWKVYDKLREVSQKTVFLRANLTSRFQIERVFEKIKNMSGIPAPDVLINAAAVFAKRPFAHITQPYLARTFAVNFSVPIMMSQSFVKFAGKKKAKIINISDSLVKKYQPGFSVYSASKAALENATKVLAKELAPNITVALVSPGIIHWPKNLPRKNDKYISIDTTAEVKKVLRAIDSIIKNDSK